MCEIGCSCTVHAATQPQLEAAAAALEMRVQEVQQLPALPQAAPPVTLFRHVLWQYTALALSA